MGTKTYLQCKPFTVPLAVATHRVHTDADDHAFCTWYAPYACRVLRMLYQIDLTLAIDAVAAVICLAEMDRAGTLVAHIADTETTLVDLTAAADTVFEVEVGSGGHLIPAGHAVSALIHTAGTDGTGVAGSVKIWAVVQPAEM